MSVKKRSGLGHFPNNLRTEAASELRFSPFERGQWRTSIYARNHELANGQCWSICDGHFENAVIILSLVDFEPRLGHLIEKIVFFLSRQGGARQLILFKSYTYFAESTEIGQVTFNNPKMGQDRGNRLR